MSIRRAVACSGRGPVSTTNFSGTGKDSAVPLDGALWIATQALRAWLLSACPSGTKGIGLFRASHQVSAYGRPALPLFSCGIPETSRDGLPALCTFAPSAVSVQIPD